MRHLSGWDALFAVGWVMLLILFARWAHDVLVMHGVLSP